ncbi:AI-2E family transporter [Sphingobium lignivorans]|uniref:PurR-regulated permease PerM n=1 Tax=Sphingobium lignivorans TaxID=2735886 RepID=A0ABR6NCP5_9SPHN|nr:AI-2E family transporter [Sphingobium lignivorans]MBB5984831.1 putative PurR-regulated permease PerM [Sphingobium lignivorans]
MTGSGASGRQSDAAPAPKDSKPQGGADERPGPADAHSVEFWREIKRALIWVGVVGGAALVVLLIQPLLYIMGAIVIAVMLDGGTRLLGRVLPIGRGWRLAILMVGIAAFVSWTVWLTGTQVAQQAAQLPPLIESQVARISAWLAGHGIDIGFSDMRQAGEQLMGSLGRVTAALSSAAGLMSSLIMMGVLAIFLAAESRFYSRGIAWFVPVDKRDEAHALIDKLGFTLRRLMAGRLVGMAVTGVLTGILLTLVGIPMATLLGVLTFMLAFLPNIGAILSGVLITLVGFSVDVQHGLFAIGIYFAVQTVESYLITPTVARRAVDIAPAIVLGAQILFGTLFGVLGLALADPILAVMKVFLEERAKRRMARQQQS